MAGDGIHNENHHSTYWNCPRSSDKKCQGKKISKIIIIITSSCLSFNHLLKLFYIDQGSE